MRLLFFIVDDYTYNTYILCITKAQDMKQTDTLSTVTHDFIDDFASDHDVTLFGVEVDENDFHEHVYGIAGSDKARYAFTRFTSTMFIATGFEWKHPHGAIIISGMFEKPVKAMVVETDEDGEELNYDTFDAELCAAIVAKCGKVSGFADSLLV